MTSAGLTFAAPVVNPARVARVLFGAAACIALLVLGLRWTLGAREMIQDVSARRPEFLELALRFGGISLLAAGQAIAVSAVLPALYRQRRGEWLVASVLATIFLASAVAAAVFALSGV